MKETEEVGKVNKPKSSKDLSRNQKTGKSDKCLKTKGSKRVKAPKSKASRPKSRTSEPKGTVSKPKTRISGPKSKVTTRGTKISKENEKVSPIIQPSKLNEKQVHAVDA